jgi:CheY-like chemotaxis protein
MPHIPYRPECIRVIAGAATRVRNARFNNCNQPGWKREDWETFSSDRLQPEYFRLQGAERKAIIEEFHQAASAKNRSVAGTDLGLAIARGVARLRGAGVAVESETGKTGRFPVSLPVAGESAAPDNMESMPKVLIIDDNRPSRELAVDILRPLALEVVEAADGTTGLAAAREQKPDLVILDLSMPTMDGFAVLDELRRDPDCAGTPVLAVTANAMPGERSKALQAGFSDVLTKPVRSADFRRRVEAFLNGSRV